MLSSTRKKEQKQKKNGDKNGKALYEIMPNAAYGKSINQWKIQETELML